MRSKQILLVLFPVIFLLILLPFLISIDSTDLPSSIRRGDLAYSCNCGWISWDHALPWGVQTLIAELVHDSAVDVGAKQITYAQNMKIDFIGKTKLVAQISRTYVFSRAVSLQEREQMAFLIFRQTSESFEKMQASFPFSLNEGSQHSSFKGGDLTGNKIAFYRALKGYSKQQVEKLCKAVSTKASLKRLEEGYYGKQMDWQPKQEGLYPQLLNTIRTDIHFSKQKLSLTKESKNFYIEF
ncbi:hypothetical protein GXP67_05775 [Rhodocytophaga rosea]|uniref:Uncharacterized protein n=1 Tax=Rhodocytophaga rosea TaxID=2704465 RepID=A0A6C0GDX8_9BACT|nr:hypothetical protein [Rhodocytophaga rosea]QHT66209.1 hypothetical protein GXP67_05775 [Rhodocytophaga rosea]